ncbi:MAG TPA: UDP-N-acetylglucosamine 2-epimerase [Verrucomicrobiae bacterium]|nr:UDP-N-acetylglucosamine 2-epimerase [Verrucomicrobiae bacterium]
MQEESTFFRTPCLTMRPNTERPVTITCGSNNLTSPQTLWADIESVLKARPEMGEVPPFWDGRTAERVVECLLDSQN